MNPNNAASLMEKAQALADLESGLGYLKFLPHVIVDAQPLKRPFREIAEPWQWDRAYRAAPALDDLAGVTPVGQYTGVKSFWNGYHKGSDKTHDDARELCWLLGWSKRRLNCYVCAGSEDQAALITTAMIGMIKDNKWIADRVEATKLTAKGASGSELTVLPMNAWTSQGIFPDYVIASEVTHWMYDDGKRFWEFILESVNKRPQCVLKVETNAGHKGSWQWNERNRIERSKFWSFFEAPVGKPLPKWMNQEKIDDDSQGLTPGERDRLYKNRWIDPGEEHGYLTAADADACIDQSLIEQVKGDRYTQYYIVLDYGGVHDRAAMALMHPVKGTYPTEVIVDRLDCWQGTHEQRIDILCPTNPDLVTPENPEGKDYSIRSIEAWVDISLKNFQVGCIIADPTQLEALLMKYERLGRRVERFKYRGGQKNMYMAQLLKNHVQSKKIRWSPVAGRLPEEYSEFGVVKRIEDNTLTQELSQLVIKPMVYGYRFDHESGRHDDRAVVLGMGLVWLIPEVQPKKFGMETVPKEPSQNGIAVPPTHQDYASRFGMFGVGQHDRR